MTIDNKNKTMGKLLVNFANSNTLEEAKKDMDKKIKKLYYKNKNVINIVFDTFYEEKRENLKDLLNEIIAINNLSESKLIKTYIRYYNQSCTSKIILNENGKIKTKNFLRDLDSVQYDKILTYIIIRFLMNFEVNKQYLHRCKFEDCRRYFLSERKGSHITTCNKCRSRSTLTKDEQHKKYVERKQDKYKKKVIDYIINLQNQNYENKNIEMMFEDDDRLQKLLQDSNLSFKEALKASNKEKT